MIRSTTVFILAAAASIAAGAEASSARQLHVGDASVDGSRLQPYDNVWRYSLRPAGGDWKPQALWTDHLQRVHRDGRELLQRVQGTVYVNGKTTSVVNTFDPGTLAPVSAEARGTEGEYLRRDFDGSRVTSVRRTAQDPAEKRATLDLDQAPFDFFGGMYGLLIAMCELEPGIDLAIPSIDEFEDKARSVTVHVEREEAVTAGRLGKVNAWVVSTRLPEYDMKFWLTKSPPYVLRLDMHLNKNNADATFEML